MLVAASTGLIGTFLVLRKSSMIGDAISHAVLPGLVISFLMFDSRNTIPMLIGAAIFGILTTFIIEIFHKKGKLPQDASIGITYTWLFAIGIILVSYFTKDIDFDQDCVLYGEIAMVPLDIIGGTSFMSDIPRPTVITGFLFLVILLYIGLGYKGLKITTFDPNFAGSVGISVAAWNYSIMSMVSLSTVVSFESVGAILVVAFLIAPAATAYLITNKLSHTLALAVLFGCIAAFGGYYLAVAINGSIAGGMSTVAGLEFFIAMIIKLAVKKKSKQVVLVE